jgi:hypothetical protein
VVPGRCTAFLARFGGTSTIEERQRIDPLPRTVHAEGVNNALSTILVLGGTGKIGSRLAARFAKLGLNIRTAACHGADVHFDWDDPTTHRPALPEVDGLYLVAPVMRMDFAAQVTTLLDLAEAGGVRHATARRGHRRRRS